ncbi:DUF2642 domain-containing protein [Paenibacillus ginsengarvi]|uniref:DUF2642 domain-containing protein n=1 Tax=Paenibacillus ginsengarvi TaxID=400777 RepID=A0A3B0CL02_9BACL|nr:DUF2642 domain-containing protein [Paenibacillus ginsengarvi]RKN85531.1 DUF2642 domain-containing protein [Paenibacillus ginsengarvi]
MNRSTYYGYSYAYVPASGPAYPQTGNEQRSESAVIPQNLTYVTKVEPVFTQHLVQHKGMAVSITTTVGKLEGILDDVFIDHVTLLVNGKKHHIRLGEIVYFEKREGKK